MKLDRSQVRLHLSWGIPALAVMLLGGGWYLLQSHQYGDWVGGGSAAGLGCGVMAGTIILFEMLLWPRKSLRALRLGPARHWMAAHIWFGLASLPLAILHSGFHWGGYLSATLLLLLIITVVSGVYGLAVQNIVPHWLLRNLPAETIYSQIEHVSRQNVEDAEQMLVAAVGPRDDGNRILMTVESELESERAVVIGAVRERGRLTGREVRTSSMRSHRADAKRLWQLFDSIRPFLLAGRRAGGPIADVGESSKYFEKLRDQCHSDSGEIIGALEQWCDQRRQFDAQTTAHRWLHGWIPIHIGLSVALTILLIVHILVALRYW